jgi:cytochrome P450
VRAAHIAGYGTTVDGIGTLEPRVLVEPARRERVLADRSLVPRIVDESLRIDPPVWNMARTVTTETEMARCQTLLGREGDARLRRGHRDPERFEGPNDFDIDREGRSDRLAFGSGRHGCIGEGPGRLELTRVLEHMLDNFPDLEVDRDAVWGGREHARPGGAARAHPA